MNLYLRMLIIVITGLWRKPLKALDTSILTMHVFPNDLDTNLHMNNGRYLTIMDLGRIDLLKRAGLLKLMVQNKWMPIVGTATIEFQRPLKFWQKYELHTHVSSWDEKWIYLEQTFYSHGKITAVGKIKGLLRGREGKIPPQFYMEALQSGIVSP